MIYFVIPVYNEALNLQELRGELGQVLTKEEKFLVFSDDGSTDGSVSLIGEIFKDLPHIVLGDGINRGPGAAFDTAFNWVLNQSKHKEDLVISMEADCTADLTQLDNMLYLSRNGFDLVLASVYAQGGGFEKTNFLRKLISALANLLMRFVFNIKVLTLSSFFRIYRVDLLRAVQQHYQILIREQGFICMLEILLKAINCGAKVIEVPTVLHSSRRKGASKMKVLKTAAQYLLFLFRFRNQAKRT